MCKALLISQMPIHGAAKVLFRSETPIRCSYVFQSFAEIWKSSTRSNSGECPNFRSVELGNPVYILYCLSASLKTQSPATAASTGSIVRTLIRISTRDPRRLMIETRRSSVKRDRSALRISQDSIYSKSKVPRLSIKSTGALCRTRLMPIG